MWWTLLLIYLLGIAAIIIFSGYSEGYDRFREEREVLNFLDIAFLAAAWPIIFFGALFIIALLVPMYCLAHITKNLSNTGVWLRKKLKKDD